MQEFVYLAQGNIRRWDVERAFSDQGLLLCTSTKSPVCLDRASPRVIQLLYKSDINDIRYPDLVERSVRYVAAIRTIMTIVHTRAMCIFA